LAWGFTFDSIKKFFIAEFSFTKFYSARATGSQVHRAFPLIGISITAIFISIQFSLPLSLGLLGALSIVRFRTPIKEPEEIGFIMLVVASSLCCSTFNLSFLVILLLVCVIALVGMQFFQDIFKGDTSDGTIILTLPSADFQEKNTFILQILEELIPKGRIDSITDNNGETVISFNYIRLEQEVFLQLQDKLRAGAASARANLFYNKQGVI
ncbi:MAG: DUF4956 domain-containing protein, partial [Candidatus Electrothrix sp. LOE2]|nr:DUF4956 domain-containing protein [Candidatus Electrothrix sp. LOE2]